MTIVDKLKASIQAVHEKMPVYYHDEPTLNLLAESMEFPCVIVQLITQGNITVESGQVREVVSVAVFFVEPSEFDFDAEQNEQVIDRCRQRAYAWLLAMPFDKYFRMEYVERTQRAYERFDAILTGYGMLLRLQELVGQTDCKPEPEPTPIQPIEAEPIENPNERI